ncbi:MAG: hypothetical protein HXS44_00970 [Theionarchaea archaeon]|nr:hypothetical protein [Theionarchaea archaeon]
MSVSIPSVISYSVAIAATLLLSAYFFREYATKRLRASLAWAIGLLLYAFGQISDLSVDISGEVAVGKPTLAVALIFVALGMTLFYYGTSLLFFSPGSFFREKISVIIFVIYTVFFFYLITVLPLEGLKGAVVMPIQLGTMFPIFLVIAILFYRVSERLSRDDPRRRTVTLVAVGWSLAAVNAFLRGTILGRSTTIDTAILALHAVAWLFVLYGMAIGKAARS